MSIPVALRTARACLAASLTLTVWFATPSPAGAKRPSFSLRSPSRSRASPLRPRPSWRAACTAAGLLRARDELHADLDTAAWD